MNECGIHVQISSDPVNVSHLIHLVTDPSAGGISLFLGTTRDHIQGPSGTLKKVVRLEYEAYEPLALKTLYSIAQELKSVYGLHAIAVYHRIGVVGISQSSLAVVASGVHRREPMEAVQECVKQIKASVPIWKKEVYSDGSVWKGNVECLWGACTC